MTQSATMDQVQSGQEPPSGQQFHISHGEHHATVVEVGVDYAATTWPDTMCSTAIPATSDAPGHGACP